MKLHHVEQNSPEWLELRKGIPTASNFYRILTPKQLKPSASRDDYAIELAMEKKGVFDPQKFTGNAATERGHECEPLAVERYAELTGNVCKQVGFVTPTGTANWGCSPDRLVTERETGLGLLEVKTRYPRGLISDILDEETATRRYWLQCQAQLWITELEWCDLFLFAPEMTNTITIRIRPDDRAFNAFEEHLPPFCSMVSEIAKVIEPNPNLQEVCFDSHVTSI